MRFLVLLSLMTLAVQPGCLASEEAPSVTTAPSRRPPARPAVVSVGERRWFVLSHVWLGAHDRDGRYAGRDAWRSYGFDLDRRFTTTDDSTHSRGTCVRRDGSPRTALADGDDGLDNNFGQHVFSVLESLKPGIEQSANQEMASGHYTLLLRVDGASEGDNARAPGALYAAGPFEGTPTFQPNEQWPVWASAVEGNDLERPIRKFPRGYVRDGVWVSGEIGEAPEPIWIPIIDGPVDLHASAVISLDMRSGRGVIAGGLPLAEVARAGENWAAKYGLCNGATHDLVTATLSNFADLTIGATDLQDPARTCDAVSFGLGFDAAPVSAPVAVVPGPSLPRPTCAR